MAYTPYGWQNPYYPPPMQDNLMQMRQMQQPQMQSQIPQALQNPVAQSGVQWVSGEQREHRRLDSALDAIRRRPTADTSTKK